MILVGACGRDASPMASAKHACHIAAGPTHNATATYGQTLSHYTKAAPFAAKAAARERRWEKLSESYQTLIAAWTDVVDLTGPDATDQTKPDPAIVSRLRATRHRWLDPAQHAENILRSECAIAAVAS